MLKQTTSEKNSANRSARKAKKLAHERLLKYREERIRRQEAEDEAIKLSKLLKKSDKILAQYKEIINESKEKKKGMEECRGGPASWW